MERISKQQGGEALHVWSHSTQSQAHVMNLAAAVLVCGEIDGSKALALIWGCLNCPVAVYSIL